MVEIAISVFDKYHRKCPIELIDFLFSNMQKSQDLQKNVLSFVLKNKIFTCINCEHYFKQLSPI